MPGNNNNTNSDNTNNNNNMDPSFYDDNNAQFASTNSIKRPMSLDLNSNNKNSVIAKKLRLNGAVSGATGPIVLESPDLQSLKFNTPDLEKFILSNNLLATPTPSLVFPPTKATTEQEDFSKGFVDALEHLRNSENSQQICSGGGQPNNTTTTIGSTASVVTTNGMSGGSITYTNLDENFPVAIKDEPQTVPTSPPLSPIDMETQEKIKLERKRQRNRVAASKCRKRKLERISKLEDKVKILKGENVDLGAVVKNLKEHVFQLKQEVIDHINSGCNISIYGNGTTTMLQAK